VQHTRRQAGNGCSSHHDALYVQLSSTTCAAFYQAAACFNNWAAPKTAGPVSLQDNVQWFATNWKPKLGTAGCSSTSRLVQTTNAVLNGSLQPDTAACPSWAP
jgi:hypothetical protein